MSKLPIFHLFHRAGQMADQLYDSHGCGLTPRQFIVLAALAGIEGRSQTDIGRATGIDRSTLAELVKRLVGQGYLRRRRLKTDARAYDVRLTPTGRQALAKACTVADSTDERILAALSPEQRTVLVEALQSLLRAHEAED